MSNKEIKELYSDVLYPVATVDANSYITWANKAAKELYPNLFRRDGLRRLARFSDERVLISRYVKNNIGATITPRQIGYTNLKLTLTPLPENGREMLLTLSVDRKFSPIDTGFGAGMIACTMPKIRETMKKLCADIEALGDDIGEHAQSAIKSAGEMINTADHLSLFSDLSLGAQPRATACDTQAYFGELADAVKSVLKDTDISFNVNCKEEVVVDHALVARAVLMLIANAVEHGSGKTQADISTSDGELIIKIRNDATDAASIDETQVVYPYFSGVEDEDGNDRVGIGLTLAQMIAKAHKGSLRIGTSDGFEVTLTVPSERKRNVPATAMRSKNDYIADRFSPVMLELSGLTK